jgi:hypothetical protein
MSYLVVRMTESKVTQEKDDFVSESLVLSPVTTVPEKVT